MSKFVEIYGIKYYAKPNTRTTLAKWMCRDMCYGTQLNIVFDTKDEFYNKVLDKIPQEIKDEFEAKVPSRITSVENDVAILKDIVATDTNRLVDSVLTNTVAKLEQKVDIKFYTLETKVDTNTISIETLRAEYEAKIKELEDHNQSQDVIIAENKSEIVSLKLEVSDLQSQVSTLQKTVKQSKQIIDNNKREISRNRNEIQRNQKEIRYINENQDKIVDKGIVETGKLIENYFQEKLDELHNIIETLNIQELGEIVNENRRATEEDKRKFVQLNNLLKQYNGRVNEYEIKTNKNINILDKRSISNKEKIVNIDNRSNINASNIEILDKRTLRQGTDIESVKVDMFLTREQRLRKYRN